MKSQKISGNLWNRFPEMKKQKELKWFSYTRAKEIGEVNKFQFSALDSKVIKQFRVPKFDLALTSDLNSKVIKLPKFDLTLTFYSNCIHATCVRGFKSLSNTAALLAERSDSQLQLDLRD